MDGTDVREQSNGVSVSEQNTAAEQELADGLSLMEQFLSDPSHDYKTLKYGDVLEGIIMHLDRDELLVDIGSKAEGIVPAKEYSSLSAEEKDKLEIGDKILVFVVQPENAEGHPVVSIDRARQEKSWRKLQEIHEANEVIEAEVTNYNKGGLLVNLDGVRGFVPASQVSEIRGGDESSKQADMARLIGTSLPLKVIEINRHRNRLILSERQAIQERRDVMKERLIEELEEGEIRKGRVSSICDFGAFVDIGGADGLVHLSELSWSRVRHPSELLKIGEEVDVYVLGINAQEKKIALSIKRTQAEPWSRVASSYEVGKLVRGNVTQLANFGAFARIEDGIEGLIHVSELADERIQHPKQVVGEGQELLLRIIRIDPQRRRMGLSLRRALDTPDDELLSVFGEGILEERDALVQKIQAALEAEGLTGQFAEPAADSAEGDSGATSESGGTVDAENVRVVDQVAAFEERQQRAGEAANARREARQNQQRQQRQSESSSFADEDMSAMAMAFALAGGPDDLISAIEQPAVAPAPEEEQPTASAEAAPAAVEAEAPVEAPAAEESAEAAPAEATAEPEAAQAEEEAPAEAAAEEAPKATASSKLPSEGQGEDWVAGDGTNNIPEGFALKGNASSRIYHPQESGSYDVTVAEIYFATPEAAERAGYRLPKNLQAAGESAAAAAAKAAEEAAESTSESGEE
jgi:small subunit ribosomal protein S1